MKNKRLYTPEFKLSVVKEVIEQGKRPSAVAREYKILPSTLFSWRALYQQFGEAAFNESDLQYGLIEKENLNLHKQLEQLKAREIIYERIVGKLTLENHRLREHTNTWFSGKASSGT